VLTDASQDNFKLLVYGGQLVYSSFSPPVLALLQASASNDSNASFGTAPIIAALAVLIAVIVGVTAYFVWSFRKARAAAVAAAQTAERAPLKGDRSAVPGAPATGALTSPHLEHGEAFDAP